MCTTYKYDIITLSETWLKDNQYLIEHVQISGYTIDYKDTYGKRGGGVGLYIKDRIKFKRRFDIEKLDGDIEHMWLEILDKNKYSTFFLGILYQPKSDDASKEIWITKLETLLSNISIKWDGVMILAGDTNIDLLKDNRLTQKYIDVLTSFNLIQWAYKKWKDINWSYCHEYTKENRLFGSATMPRNKWSWCCLYNSKYQNSKNHSTFQIYSKREEPKNGMIHFWF